jgi:hypothetical protein
MYDPINFKLAGECTNFKYLDSMITNYAREIKSRIVMAKIEFNR